MHGGCGSASVAVLTVLPVLWLLVARLPAVADGVRRPSAWRVDGVEVATVNGQPGDLRPGDTVVKVNGIPVQAWPAAPLSDGFEVGRQVTYRVVHDGVPGEVDVPVTLVSYPFGGV